MASLATLHNYQKEMECPAAKLYFFEGKEKINKKRKRKEKKINKNLLSVFLSGKIANNLSVGFCLSSQFSFNTYVLFLSLHNSDTGVT